MQYDENAEKYGYEGEMTPMKCDELTAYKGDVTIPVYGTIADADVYLKEKADEAIEELKEFAEDACLERDDNQTAIDELQAENAELKQKLESVQASMYADVVDANMENRRLQRALYKALANWAKCEERINNRDAYEASEYLPSAEDKFRKKAERWSEMERKCRAKAESYL